MTGPLSELADRCRRLSPKGRRNLIAVAGPPASGKSTMAAQLAQAIGPGSRAVPMDGFHLDDRVLADRGLSDRKGAPHTFDAQGFIHAMRRLAMEPEVVLPVFDRSREIAIAGALPIGPDCTTAVVEGNYLLLDEDPWRELASLWDLTVYLDEPEEVLRARLVERWQRHGKPGAEAWIETNDLPNIRLVREHHLPADVTIRIEG